ncbi:ABC transporter permease subunit, partial [Roseateles sp. P5_E11]
TRAMQERFDVRPRDENLGSSKFSGGNQQKLILAREIGEQPTVLLVGQPTRGVDIGAIEFIHGQLRALRDAGCAVLLVSSELDVWLGAKLPAVVMLPLLVIAAAFLGMLWAALPAYLQAWRGSHIVITTIMFNFLAAALNGYLLVNWLRPAGSMSVESAEFSESARMPALHQMAAALGYELPSSPLNLSLVIALIACVFVGWFLWKSAAGYAVRSVGSAPRAAHYAGIRPRAQVLIAMAISGALAGMVGINEISGVQGKLTLDFVAGAGFTGIAVSLMGRNHPVGIVLASLLFGVLYQGGVEVSFELQGFSREMVVTAQGLIVLFSGAMATVSAPLFARLYGMVKGGR